jgi:hypothetical protein
VVLDDCSGAAAEALLEHPTPITRREPGSPLARAVVETDAIVLLVDAASTPGELQEAFGEFDAFLTTVERAKTDARDVGGFPVFLVLTQCDRLAQPGDTHRVWEARVNDRAEAAGRRSTSSSATPTATARRSRSWRSAASTCPSARSPSAAAAARPARTGRRAVPGGRAVPRLLRRGEGAPRAVQQVGGAAVVDGARRARGPLVPGPGVRADRPVPAAGEFADLAAQVDDYERPSGRPRCA